MQQHTNYLNVAVQAVQAGIVISVILTIIKVITVIYSGSLTVMAITVDSAVDIIIEVINYLFMRKAYQDSDKYDYGLGKLEAVGAIINGLFLVSLSIMIIYRSIVRIHDDYILDYTFHSIVMMGITLLLTIFLYLYVKKAYKRTDSIILAANLNHYKMDILLNLVAIFSLIVVHFTNYYTVDIIGSISIAIYIIYTSFGLLKNGFNEIIDKTLDDDILMKIKNIVYSKENVLNMHDFRARKSGNTNFVEMHITFSDNDISLKDAHDVADFIEAGIFDIDNSKEWIVTVHLDPQ